MSAKWRGRKTQGVSPECKGLQLRLTSGLTAAMASTRASGVPYLVEHLLGTNVLSAEPRCLQQLLHAAQALTEGQKEFEELLIQMYVGFFCHIFLNQEEKRKNKTQEDSCLPLPTFPLVPVIAYGLCE